MQKKILSFIISCIFLIGIQFIYTVTVTEEKITLERSIRERVEELVEKIIGSKNFVVLVTVEIKTPEQTPSGNTDVSRPVYPGMYLREEEYLPGVTYSYLPVTNPATNLPMQVAIDKIIINIAMDSEVPDELINRVKTELPILLGLNLMRGDSVNINKIKFQTIPTWRVILEQMLPHLYIPLLIIIVALFLFGPVTHFFKTVVQSVQLRIDADARLRSTEKTVVTSQGQTGLLPGTEFTLPEPSPVAALGMPGSAELKKEEKILRKHFSFINKDNLKSLWYLIKDEEPSVIALIMSYLPPDLVAELMTMLDMKTQAKVALELVSMKMPEPEKVQEIENYIKSRIDYCIGGEDYFLSLLDRADKEVQEDILHMLSLQNPALADKIRGKIFLFEDILFLDKTTLQKIIREAQRRGVSLALALKGASDEIKNKIMDCLTEGGRAMLAE
ncbi:MAG: hypothetical protein NZ928_06825 [Endomicrobia bacterium]|nr:hypothetical protein [Endomicrobiia bacterium]MDW8055414.1 FliG C-terminal domain-containing protein [Elusimicrobiota bacterium]